MQRQVRVAGRQSIGSSWLGRCNTGDMPQTARMEVITAVRGFSVRAIISTDLAARGLDLGAPLLTILGRV